MPEHRPAVQPSMAIFLMGNKSLTKQAAQSTCFRRAAQRACTTRIPYALAMLRLTEIKLPLDHEPEQLPQAIVARLNITRADLLDFTVYKRSYDARKRNAIHLIYTVDAQLSDEIESKLLGNLPTHVGLSPDMRYHFVTQAPTNLKSRPIIIGFGPCGLFAALILAQMGFRPIVLERGKDVRQRTKDTWGLWRGSVLNPESNVQFGEGGAGTFSDGKLYSQIKDPHFYGRKVLEEFVAAGAPDEILYVSKPHIGTFRLVSMIEKMRAHIETLGGEIRFGARVEDLLLENQQVRGVRLAGGEELLSEQVILAVGHSARDTFQMLFDRGVYMEPKAFSIGFRIEHPQSLIDQARFGSFAGHELLGAADYKLVHHAKNGRSVYSFCMCPGGTVVAATSEAGHVVTNGMSQYSRNERNANAGFVVGISPEDYPGGPLAGIDFQRFWERRAFELGGSDYRAPAQLVGDFLAGRPSREFGSVQPSYKPGVKLTDLSTALPDYAIEAMREALPALEKQIKGFSMPDAILTAVETRTSSPLRIKRGEDYQSINTPGLYPAGEGAAYAGGIYSAAIDGMEVAQAVALAIVANRA